MKPFTPWTRNTDANGPHRPLNLPPETAVTVLCACALLLWMIGMGGA